MCVMKCRGGGGGGLSYLSYDAFEKVHEKVLLQIHLLELKCLTMNIIMSQVIEIISMGGANVHLKFKKSKIK